MALGVFQVLVYRLVYSYLLPFPDDIGTWPGLALYLVLTYVLVLKVVGMFHLTLGILALFGYDLPPLFNWFFFARGFSDLWRRINTYWKDFVTKVIYYPVVLRLKRLGIRTSVVISTVIVLIATWILHSWQYFWKSASAPFIIHDAVFWGVFAVALSVSALVQMRKSKASTRSPWVKAFVTGAQVVAMFTCFTLLWNYWVTTPPEWRAILSLMQLPGLGHLFIFWVAAWVLVSAGAWIISRAKLDKLLQGRHPVIAWLIPAWIAAVAVFGIPQFNLADAVGLDAIVNHRLNQQDVEFQRSGYYERMMPRTSLVNEVPVTDAGERRMQDDGMTQRTTSVLMRELLPNKSTYTGVLFETNRWGMRDKDYELEKPDNTYRICLLGSSYEVGRGVPYEDRFETLVEERLNRELSPRTGRRYEILNFAFGGYKNIQLLYLFQTRGLKFDPDALFFFGHKGLTLTGSSRNMAETMDAGSDLEYDYLKDVARRAGVRDDDDVTTIKRKLLPFENELVLWTYDFLVDSCQANGIVPVWIYLPSLEEIPKMSPRVFDQRDLANSRGFATIVLEGVYGDGTMEQLRLNSGDTHPNIEGHRRIAGMLFDEIMALDSVLHLTGQP